MYKIVQSLLDRMKYLFCCYWCYWYHATVCVDADGLRRRGVVDDDDFMVLFFVFFSVNQSAEYHVRVVCRHVVERFISVLLWHPSPIF